MLEDVRITSKPNLQGNDNKEVLQGYLIDFALRRMRIPSCSRLIVCPTRHWRSTMFHEAIEYFLFAEAWRQVTDKVQDARAAARMKQLSYDGTLSFC